MTDPIDGRIGEAWAGERPNGAHLNVVLARRGSAAASAAIAALANPRPGHLPFLACLEPGTLVRPITVVVNKTTIEDEDTGRIIWGAGQVGIAQGVLDAVAEGLLDAEQVAEIVILVAAWADVATMDDGAYRAACREAMRGAIADALEPPSAAAVRALAERREEASSPYFDGD
jgi:5,6,7,8-tetrahydromethanopterin hydro-lyase